jgi:two-component system, sensor histidine kinase and response regulator
VKLTVQTQPRILVVDDDPIICAFLGEMLEELDAQVSYANTGEAAFKQALEINPDVVLLDINLPDVSGIEICQRMKSLPELVRTPIVFVTALSEIESEAEAIKAGATGFIPKPPHRALVMANVQNALRLRAMNDEIDRLVDYREKLTHMIVHDINNLLTVNLSNADLLMLHPEMPTHLNKLAESVYNSAHDIKVMTAGLLDVAKLESQTLPVNLETINVSELIQQRSKLVTHQLKSRSLNFAMEETKNPAYATADGYLLARVIDNLLFNAIKFCPVGGQITSTVSGDKDSTTIALTNDGPAIPRELHDKIFAPFAQIESSNSKARLGVGLGLALCRMASMAMNGRIDLESPVQPRTDGVQFMVTLPTSD